MRVLSATLLLFGIFTVALSQSCNNPLLAQQEIIDRVGGSANILSTPRTLTANVSVCQFLVGQSVCITDAGFTALATNLDTYRNAFQERSKKRDEKRFQGVGSQLQGQNQGDKRTQNVIQIGNLFNQTVIGFNASGASAPYDFSQFLSKVSAGGWGQYVAPSNDQLNKQNDMIRDNNTKNGKPREQGVMQGGPQQTQTQGQNQQQQQQGNQQGNLQNQLQDHHQNGTGQQQGGNGTKRFLQQQGGQGQGNGNGAPPQNNQGWMQVQGNLGQAKAKCGVAVMKQYYFASCLAVTATSNTNGTVGGDASNPTVTVSNDACQAYKSKCTDYFTYATQAENTKSNCDNANSLFAMQIYTTISNSSLSSTEISAQLNIYAVQVLAALNSAAGNQVTKPWAPVSCNSSNTGASDCNYICTKVITATGFSEDNFNLVSTTTTGAAVSGRVLGSGSVILSSTSSGINPDAAISDSNKAVTMSAQSSVDYSSASSLVASVAVVIATVIALMI